MNETQRREFEDMKRQLAELKSWQERRERQQITYPLDPASKQVIYKDVLMLRKDRPVLEGSLHGGTNGFMVGTVNGVDVYFQMTN